MPPQTSTTEIDDGENIPLAPVLNALNTDIESEQKSRQLTVDQVVNEIVKKPTVFSALFVVVAMSFGFSVDSLTYLTVFAGVIPYKKWHCVSSYCIDLYTNSTDKPKFFSRATLCDSNLNLGEEDFVFANDNRTSFAVDWGLYCSGEAKMSLLSSVIFAGAYAGFIIASPLFDTLGRKKITIATAFLSFLTTLASGFSTNYNMMVVLRFFMGLGKNVCWIGLYCWILEFTPTTMSTSMTVLAYTSQGLGFLLVNLVAYFVKDWRYIFVSISVVTFLSVIPMLFVPESPRFLLTKGRLDQAKANLEGFSRLVGSPVSLTDVELSYTQHKQNWLKQLKDFYVYPTMGRQTVLLALVWMSTCAQSYTFNFGWSKISKDFYLGYVFAATITILGFYVIVPVCKYLGKKRGLICFLLASSLFYCLAMVHYNISPYFTVEHLASLLGFMCILGAYTMIHLYTGELTPTSHRGMVYCICGSFGRIGSSVGPYIQLLFTLFDKRITFGIFAGVSLLCMLIIVFTRDPTGRVMPETPKELELMNKRSRVVEQDVVLLPEVEAMGSVEVEA